MAAKVDSFYVASACNQHASEATIIKKKLKKKNRYVNQMHKWLIVAIELKIRMLSRHRNGAMYDPKKCVARLDILNSRVPENGCQRILADKHKMLVFWTKLREWEFIFTIMMARKNNYKYLYLTLWGIGPINTIQTFSSIINIGETTAGGAAGALLSIFLRIIFNIITAFSKILKCLQQTKYYKNVKGIRSNQTVLGALARVLREDWKKSLDLSYNVVYTFFCFSVFSNFHTVISHFKIGSLCMDIIDGELQRTDQYREQLTKRRKATDGAMADPNKLQQDYDRNLKKYQAVVAKQDQVLRVCTYLLLNIAEDARVEEKMRRKNIVGLLVRMVDRESPDLLLLVVSFLKKLSIYVENKDDMADLNIVEKVSRLVPNENSDLLNVTVRLLLNLSFDGGLRQKMIKVGLLPKLVSLIGEERHQQAVLAVLYHLSVDDKCKSMFTYTDGIPNVMKLVLGSPGGAVPLELMALAVNLAANKRNAQLICEGAGLKLLMKRALKNRDPLLAKMIRNIAQHEGPTRAMFSEFVGELCSVVSVGGNEEFVLECVGILGNLAIPELDFCQLLSKYNLTTWIKDCLMPDMVEDDLVLEVVVLLGTVAQDQAAAQLIVQTGILEALVNLLNAKQEDDEVVLQIAYVFYQLTRHEATRPKVISLTEVPAYLIDLMHDKNSEIRRVCDTTLDIISEHDEDWSSRIQCHKFRWYNSQWLEMVEEAETLDTMGGEEMAGGEGLGHSYLHHSDVLAHHGLYSGSLEEDLSSPESEEYPGMNGHADGSSRPSSSYTNRFSADLEQFADQLLKKAGV
ncbi:unnamed protein product, partial [Meganyctiphanes norvegica]